MGLAERRERIEADLLAAAGGASLCAISRSGDRVDGVKYLEGRLAVVAEAMRVEQSGGDLVEHLTTALANWSLELEVVREVGHGRSWLPYRAGGVDELTMLLEELAPDG